MAGERTKTTGGHWLGLAPWASRRREDLLQLLDRLNPTIAELTQAIDQEVEKSGEARRLMTHPGVGPLTALAFVLIIGKAERFQCGKQIAAYLGLVPLEDSSGERRRLGHITKQGTRYCASCWWSRPRWRRAGFRNGGTSTSTWPWDGGRKIAKVAMARKLAIRLFWMMRQGWDYEQMKSSVCSNKRGAGRPINFSMFYRTPSPGPGCPRQDDWVT
jgi:transposase